MVRGCLLDAYWSTERTGWPVCLNTTAGWSREASRRDWSSRLAQTLFFLVLAIL